MISLIVAMSKNRVIGKTDGNKIPWFIKGEQRHLKLITIHHPIIMGRKTFESIGKRLQFRRNIIVTRDKNYVVPEKVWVANSLEEALEKAKSARGGNEEIFILGGGQIFNEAMEKNLVDRIYLTFINAEVEGDVLFPEVDEKKWKLVETEKHITDDLNHWEFEYRVYNKTN